MKLLTKLAQNELDRMSLWHQEYVEDKVSDDTHPHALEQQIQIWQRLIDKLES